MRSNSRRWPTAAGTYTITGGCHNWKAVPNLEPHFGEVFQQTTKQSFFQCSDQRSQQFDSAGLPQTTPHHRGGCGRQITDTTAKKNWALFQDKQTTERKKKSVKKKQLIKANYGLPRNARHHRSHRTIPGAEGELRRRRTATGSETSAQATQSRAFVRPLPKRDAGATETAVGPGRPPTRLGHRPRP